MRIVSSAVRLLNAQARPRSKFQSICTSPHAHRILHWRCITACQCTASRANRLSQRTHLAILPSCHLAILPSCHLAILPSCHLAILPSCHLAILVCIKWATGNQAEGIAGHASHHDQSTGVHAMCSLQPPMQVAHPPAGRPWFWQQCAALSTHLSAKTCSFIVSAPGQTSRQTSG